MSFIPIYILILGFTIVIDFYAGMLLENSIGRKKKIILIVSLCANIGVLALFKYYNFLLDNFSILLSAFNWSNPFSALKIILPIGLSFHTFQAMSYTIEVYRGHQKAERNFGIYSLYVMFYPQLVAGPIERPQNLLHQFREAHFFDFERFKSGFTQMAFGLFKKVVIADRLALAVDYSYANIESQSGLSLIIASIFYAFQIYCDFSGYSDMAIGAARIMGFKLMDNFNMPYFSKSISEFWKRWHISLSTWFKDYLYISLGGNRVKMSRWFLNIFLVFTISGLWHGANWTFIIWGAIHGLFLIIASLKDKAISSFNLSFFTHRYFQIPNMLITFSLVCLAWVFFRASSPSDGFHIIEKMMQFSLHDKVSLFFYRYELLFCFFLIAFLMVKEKLFLQINTSKNSYFYLINIAIVFSSYLFGVFNQKQFIYFQF